MVNSGADDVEQEPTVLPRLLSCALLVHGYRLLL